MVQQELIDALGDFVDERMPDTMTEGEVRRMIEETVEKGVTEERVREIVKEELGDEKTETKLEWLGLVGAFERQPIEMPTKSQADYVASGRDSLVEAIRGASDGEIIYVESDCGMGGWAEIDVATDVKIVGNRNVANGNKGPRIYVGDTEGESLIRSRNTGIELLGLRLEGPIPDQIIEYDERKKRSFAHLLGNGCRVANCEVYGWPFAGIVAGAGGYAPEHIYEYNHFHDNLMKGLGYGLELYNGFHRIRYNYFDRCRHAIAGFGHENNGYEARRNVVGPEPLSHAFDMHALEEIMDHESNPDLAGDVMDIVDNVFMFTHDIEGRGQEAVRIRGVPKNGALIRDNHFRHTEEPVAPGQSGDAFRQDRTDGGWDMVTSSGNKYGSTEGVKPPE